MTVFANDRFLPALVALTGAVCLLLAPHLLVTRVDHCGMEITMHMMETHWTWIFSAAAVTSVSSLLVHWHLLAALIASGALGYAVFLLISIRMWYSYQEPPAELDLMAQVFGHVIDIGLPVAMLGSVLILLATMFAKPKHS